MVRVVAHIVALSMCTNSTCSRDASRGDTGEQKMGNGVTRAPSPTASPCPSSSWSARSGCASGAPGSRCSWSRTRAHGTPPSLGTKPPGPASCWQRGSGRLVGGRAAVRGCGSNAGCSRGSKPAKPLSAVLCGRQRSCLAEQRTEGTSAWAHFPNRSHLGRPSLPEAQRGWGGGSASTAGCPTACACAGVPSP